jgi:hypothetical protein
VYLPGDVVQQRLDTLPPGEAQRETEALGISEQLPQALAQGSDVAIPLPKYLVAGREMHGAWRDDIRFERDGLSLNDAREEADLKAEPIATDTDDTTRALIAGKPTDGRRNDAAARAIGDLLKAASQPEATVEFGKAHPELTAAAKQAGLLDGLAFPIHPAVARYIRASLRFDKAERTRGQLAVSDEYRRRVREIVEASNFKVFRKGSKRAVAYGKRLEDGSTLLLQVIRGGDHSMVGRSLKRYAATANVGSIVSTLDPGAGPQVPAIASR